VLLAYPSAINSQKDTDHQSNSPTTKRAAVDDKNFDCQLCGTTEAQIIGSYPSNRLRFTIHQRGRR
jgi:hypothetical protein